MSANQHDLVITGGRVIDPETGLDAVRNIGIRNGSIVAISTDPLQGKATIDVSGHVVAPGFIDCHVHTVDLPFAQKVMLRGGVTTQLDLEAGAYPVQRFYDHLEGRSQANYGATVNTMAAREKAFNPKYESVTGVLTTDVFAKDEHVLVDMKWSTVVPDKDQIAQIVDAIDEGLRQGALGVGVAVGYMTEGVTSAETTAWQRLAGGYGRATYVHARFSSQQAPTTGILAFEEMIANAAAYGGGVFFHHMHQQALADTLAALDTFDRANQRGLSVVGEIYPYNYGASIVGADYLKPDNYGPNMGRSYKDIIETATLKPLTKERYEELMKTNPQTSIMFYGATDEDMTAGLLHPSSVVGSDAFPLTVSETAAMARDWDTPYDAVQGHPRLAGTAAKVLRMARENPKLALTDAISKMSYMVASFLEQNGVPQMAYKGRIQVGADADIVVFDPDSVTDNATMQQAGLPATGIPYVVVNGTVVVDDSTVQEGVFPGRPIRLPVQNA
jgi:N-acyl-D-aspartate/D-glutamate deacylase